MLVKNKINTSNEALPRGFNSYLEYWEEKKNRRIEKCSNLVCKKDAKHGAHVFRKNTGKFTYIVPLCAECNNHNNNDYFEVNEIELVELVNKRYFF